MGRPNAQTTVQTPPGYDSEQYPGNPGQVTSCLFSRRWIAEKKYTYIEDSECTEKNGAGVADGLES